MKSLIAAAFAVATITGAQAGVLPVPMASTAASGVENVSLICGPGFHLRGLICVRNGERVCPIGWHLGPGGHCRVN